MKYLQEEICFTTFNTVTEGCNESNLSTGMHLIQHHVFEFLIIYRTEEYICC